jgi:hypothetical protein
MIERRHYKINSVSIKKDVGPAGLIIKLVRRVWGAPPRP